MTAGAVNVIGLFAAGTLSGNVTGYATRLGEHLSVGSSELALQVALYMGSFWLGSFSCTSIFAYMEYHYNLRARSYQIPLHIEILLLLGIWLMESNAMIANPMYVSCLLLFSMGLQNALVTNVSGAVVRTTHVSGTLTDIGISMSYILFHPRMRHDHKQRKKLLLLLSILGAFILGGGIGGYLYHHVHIAALLFPIGLLEVSALSARIRKASRWTYRKIAHTEQKNAA